MQQRFEIKLTPRCHPTSIYTQVRWRTHTDYLRHVSISEQFWAGKAAKFLSVKQIGKKHIIIQDTELLNDLLSLRSAVRKLTFLWKNVLFTDFNLRAKKSMLTLQQLKIKIQKAWAYICSVWLIQCPGPLLEHFNVFCIILVGLVSLAQAHIKEKKKAWKKAKTKEQRHSNESVKLHWRNFQKQQAVKDLDNWNRCEKKAKASSVHALSYTQQATVFS